MKALVQKVGTAKCDCAKTMCGGHGRCYGLGTEVALDGYSDCECFDGYSGANCTKTVAAIAPGLQSLSSVPQQATPPTKLAARAPTVSLPALRGRRVVSTTPGSGAAAR
jgi:hypothetical protein